MKYLNTIIPNKIKLMSNQHNLRTKFIPFRPDAIAQTNNQVPQISQPVSSGQVIGHVFQNVCIGGGIMTQKIPITANVNLHVTPAVNVIGTYHLTQAASLATTNSTNGFIPAVNLIGCPSAPSKVAQAPVQSQWSSGGTIIIEDAYNRRNGKTCQAIFLGLNSNTGLYELFYGKKNNSDTDETETALRETREESSNMFVFSSSVYNDRYRVSSPNTKHHAYVVRVNGPKGGISSAVFAHNQSKLVANRAPYEWTELSGITRIDISDAISFGLLSYSRGNFTMQDVYGNYITIFSRDAEFISNALKSSMHLRGHVNQLSFISSWDDRRYGGNKMFLNGTSCFKT